MKIIFFTHMGKKNIFTGLDNLVASFKMFIDTHSHIYANEFLNDTGDMLTRAASVGVNTILMPAIDSETHAQMLDMESKYPKQCLSMMGLHPCSVNENFKKELEIVETYLQQGKFVAIGETGLDFHWDLSYTTQQYEAFEQQIEWAIRYDIPVVIHSRKSAKACIEVVTSYVQRGLRGVFHCFGDSLNEAHQIIDLGFYLGIGGVLTFKNSGLGEVLRATGLSHVVLETDAPYLAPVPNRGKRNEPAYIPLIAQKLADLLEMNITEVERITTENAKKLFRL